MLQSKNGERKIELGNPILVLSSVIFCGNKIFAKFAN